MVQKVRDEQVDQARMMALGTLCASVAHEMSNPLSYVLTNLRFLAEELPEMLLGKVSDDQRTELQATLADALEGATRVDALITNLRSYTRGDTQELGLTDMRMVTDRAMSIARGEVRRRARLITSCEGNPVAWANAASVTHIIVTLLVQAARSLPIGDPDNEVRMHCATQGRIVEMTWLCGATTSTIAPKSETEPLDLTVCRRVIEALRGVLRISHIDGKTLFYVALPDRPEAVEDEKDTQPPRAA